MFLLINFICFVFSTFAGSSIRDDCLYSTSTQKQSFDSVTVSQCQSTKMSIDYDLSSQCGDLSKNVLQKPFYHGSKVSRMPKRIVEQAEPSSENNSKNDKSHEIQISINCTHRTQPKNESKIIRFFQNILRWRHSRHIGYHSPRTNYSIDTINVRLNPVVVVTNNDTNQTLERNLVHFGNTHKVLDGNDDGGIGSGGGGCDDDNNDDDDSISNSSLKDDNETAIKDELAAYMEELRLREIR